MQFNSDMMKYIAQKAVETLKEGSQDKYAYVKLSSAEMMEPEVVGGAIWSTFVTTCFDSIEEGWDSKYVVISTLGQLFRQGKLEGFQEEFIQLGIQSIEEGWDSKHIYATTLSEIHDLLTPAQEGAFKAVCDQSVARGWKSQDACAIAGRHMAGEEMDIASLTTKALITLTKGSQDKYAYLRVVSREAIRTEDPLYLGGFIQKCIDSIPGGWDSKYAAIITLGNLIKGEKLEEHQQKKFVKTCFTSIKNGWDSKHIAVVTLAELIQDERLSGADEFAFISLGLKSIRRSWESAPVFKVGLRGLLDRLSAAQRRELEALSD